MNTKKTALSATLATIALLGANAAQALCTVNGQVEQYFTNGFTCIAWVSPSTSLEPHPIEFTFTTTDPETCDAVFNCKHQSVRATGNASACPTAGSVRFGGVISSIFCH